MRACKPSTNATRSVAGKRVLTQTEIRSHPFTVAHEVSMLTGKILAAYLTKNPVVDAPVDLNDLKASIYKVLAECAATDSRSVHPVRGRGKSTFRQRDVRAAIHASESAGKQVEGVAVDTQGTISLNVAKGTPTEPQEANEWDEVSK